MAKLRYGMVGGGPGAFIGDAHRKAISLDGTAELAAGCFSRTPEKTAEQGAALGIAPDRCYKDYKEMAAAEAAREDGIDFVVVVTPNSTHYEISLFRGRHPCGLRQASGDHIRRGGGA